MPNLPTNLIDVMNHLEALWCELDTLFGSLPADEFSRPNGPVHILAEVAIQLARFDREVVLNSLTREVAIPIELPYLADVALHVCLDQMRAARQGVRDGVALLSNADWVRPSWLPIYDCGWARVQDGLAACRWHTWSRYLEVHVRLKRDVPTSDPVITHAALQFILHFWLPCVIDRQAANHIKLQIEWTFTGPGGGQWTMDIANGQAVVREGQAFNSDLSFTQSPATFVKTLHRLHDPMMAMLTGEIRVQGFERMGDFERLFPDVRFGLPAI